MFHNRAFDQHFAQSFASRTQIMVTRLLPCASRPQPPNESFRGQLLNLGRIDTTTNLPSTLSAYVSVLGPSRENFMSRGPKSIDVRRVWRTARQVGPRIG